MGRQHDHSSTPFTEQKFPIILLCDGVTSPANLGGLFRLCDAFGVQELIGYGTEFDLNSSRLKKTARGTELHVPHSITNNIIASLQDLKQKGHHLVALEITSDSKAISHQDWSDYEKLVLVIGGERHGISEEVLTQMDTTVHIEMYGQNSSMNVVQAAAIALHEFTRS